MTYARILFLALTGAAIAPPALADDGIPDFSGRWGRNAFNFEAKEQGPKPLFNLARNPDGTNNAGQLVGDWKNPILKPGAAEIVRKNGLLARAGIGYPDPSNQCRPYQPPFTYAMQLAMEMLQKKDSITIVYNQDDQVRHIRLNSAHPKDVKPTPMGDSVGHYEGDTLVVDTIAIQPTPFNMVDRWGSPVTPSLHVVERYRLIDGEAAKSAQERHEKADGRVGGAAGVMPVDPDISKKGLQVEVTVEDPNVFTTAWSGYATFRPIRSPWAEQVCAENPVEHYEGEWVGLPRDDTPDF
jgi:hypothetical protein